MTDRHEANAANVVSEGFSEPITGAPRLFPLPIGFPNAGLRYLAVVSGGVNTHRQAVLKNLYIDPDGTVTVIKIPGCGTPTAQQSTIWGDPPR